MAEAGVALQDIMDVVKPFEERVKEMGFDFEIRLRTPGKDFDRFSMRTGVFSNREPFCSDEDDES